MAQTKVIYAVTSIKHNDEIYPANEKLDVTKFTKDQIQQLYDLGSIRIEVEGTPDPVVEKTDAEVVKPQEAEVKPTVEPVKAAPKKAVTNVASDNN